MSEVLVLLVIAYLMNIIVNFMTDAIWFVILTCMFLWSINGEFTLRYFFEYLRSRWNRRGI